MQPLKLYLTIAAATFVFGAASTAQDQTGPDEQAPSQETVPAAMDLDRLNTLILKINPEATREENMWQFQLAERVVYVVADPAADRMRIMSPIAQTGTLPPELYERMLQANFDAALDARYAIAQNLVWSVFIHPLGSLTERELLSGTAQTVTAAINFGTSFSSGATVYGGGDTNGIIGRELLEELLKREGQAL
ncbi:MAG: type III secretion system chaperone [Kordiimonadaceae bacterium]|nr:type III secretion system chaperone [Kordiimonadaceae bacterium]MBO6567236.1 type III secretion system chaperone [Kordiimonadaceae bacterium]MBO6963550.1 type III secretion system chaperone [Kordiimonadaceae bacterium]